MSWVSVAAPSTSWSAVTYTEDAAMRSTRTNYLTDSGELWNPQSWINDVASTGTDGTLAPDGAFATKLTRVTSNVNSTRQSQIRFTSDGTKTFSIHMKRGTTDTPYFQPYDGNNGLLYRYATVGFNTTPPGLFTGGGLGNYVLHLVQDAGDGWYRFGVSMSVVSASHNNLIYVYPDNIGGNGSYTYVWGAQAEDGGSMTTYIRTTNAVAYATDDRWLATPPTSESWATVTAP
jgi:hypothetical protein